MGYFPKWASVFALLQGIPVPPQAVACDVGFRQVDGIENELGNPVFVRRHVNVLRAFLPPLVLVVVAGTGPLLLAMADRLRRCGAVVAAIVEHRDQSDLMRFVSRSRCRTSASWRKPWPCLCRCAASLTCTAHCSCQPTGDAAQRCVSVAHQGRVTEIACDFAACGYGLVPLLEAATLFGCASAAVRVTVDHHQQTSVAQVWAGRAIAGL